MPRSPFFRALAMTIAMIAVQDPSRALHAQNKSEPKYQVLSPWAEADPIPLRGISKRVDTLNGRKIGLFVNYKRAAKPIAQSLDRRLRTMFPGVEVSSFYSPEWNVSVVETKNRDKFEAWAKGVDAVILLVGD